MIEEDYPSTEAHEFGLDGRVISHQYRRSIESLRRLVDEFDRVTALATPEVNDAERSGMRSSDDVPPCSGPTCRCFSKSAEVVTKRRLKLGYSGPNGGRWFPVKRDGNREWIVLIPETGVPRVKLWATDDEGRHVVTPGPSTSHFIVGTYEGNDITVLFRNGEGTVVRDSSEWESYVRLPGTVLHVDHASMRVSHNV